MFAFVRGSVGKMHGDNPPGLNVHPSGLNVHPIEAMTSCLSMSALPWQSELVEKRKKKVTISPSSGSVWKMNFQSATAKRRARRHGSPSKSLASSPLQSTPVRISSFPLSPSSSPSLSPSLSSTTVRPSPSSSDPLYPEAMEQLRTIGFDDGFTSHRRSNLFAHLLACAQMSSTHISCKTQKAIYRYLPIPACRSPHNLILLILLFPTHRRSSNG